jgi:hypothetical protein
MRTTLFALFLFLAPLAQGQTPIRIAAGESSPYTDSAGNVWSADTDFNQGSTFSTTHAIAGTSDPTLFQNERWSASTLTYAIPVPAGNWTLSLYFSENYVTGPKQRLFNVSVNGTQVLTQFDIFATAGAEFAANIQTFPVTSTGTVSITFTLGTIQNPKIDAIQFTPVLPPLTLNLLTKLVTCVKCDRTDDTPVQGTLVFEQGTNSQTVGINSDGSINLSLNISMASDPVAFTIFLENPNGTQVNGSGWSWSVPRASLAAGVATLGTLSFGGLAFTVNANGSVSFAGFLPAS